MRQIKFRAWDLSNKAMYSHAELLDDSIVNPDVLLDCLAQPGNGYDTDTVLMQYTGLKDKNGVDIFEDDIVLDNGMAYQIRYTAAGLPSYFLYSPISARPNRSLYGAMVDDTFVCHQVEVIGNAHEHPNLLKEQ